jgi:hypothetical protein
LRPSGVFISAQISHKLVQITHLITSWLLNYEFLSSEFVPNDFENATLARVHVRTHS